VLLQVKDLVAGIKHTTQAAAAPAAADVDVLLNYIDNLQVYCQEGACGQQMFCVPDRLWCPVLLGSWRS
jgi:hypothetical protein